jgi:hypothetical protein
MYRGYRHNGAITDRVDFTPGDAFTTPADVAVEEVAAALGVPVTEISAFESEANPYPQAAVVIPPQPQPVDTDLDVILAILAKPDADVTAGELKTIVLRALRRLILRGRI